ncbi:hypothetical protein B0H19DRAFT_1371135 [Mycena capillaripes]|nr:hypothetical protein B0H19DRAFT_1371135 [Mycena capillaripes]
MSPHFQLLPARHNLLFLALLTSHFVSGTQAYYYYYGETDQELHDRNIERIIGASIALGLLLLIIPAYLYYVRRKKRARAAVIVPPMAQYPFQGGPAYAPGPYGPGYYGPPFGQRGPPQNMQPPNAPPQAHVSNNAQAGPSMPMPGSEVV